ncbi:MAG TPA: sulfite exporter TauE/SafE family protein [Syntrophorhabdaceae bacterium]|nr:sulfite exporter TauE/SafE family protein [Syntrophorhabdaceae bacterium]
MNADLLWALLTGLAGSLHCLGMCGPIVVAYSLQFSPASDGLSAGRPPYVAGLTHHAAFQAGRIAAYGLLGGVGAGLVYCGSLASALKDIRTPATAAAGAFMVVLGLIVLKVIPAGYFTETSSDSKSSFVMRFIGKRLRSPHALVKATLGFATGFLPCMLSWAMVLRAAFTADITQGFLIMIVFGLGTLPVLLFTGLLGSTFSLKARLTGERMAGLSITAMGIIILSKGVLGFVR